jgi:outer membrane protein assembly factor BamB
MSRRLRTTLLATALAVSATACWPQAGGGPGHTNHNPTESVLTPATAASLHEVWAVDLRVSASWGGQVIGSVASGGGTAGGAVGRVVSVDRATGVVRWSRSVVPAGVSQAHVQDAVVVRDEIWVSWAAQAITPGGVVCAEGWNTLDLATGAAGAIITGTSTPVVVPFGGLVYQTTGRLCSGPAIDTSRVVDAGTRETVWTADPTAAGYPVVDGGTLFAASGDRLHAFSAGGCGTPTCTGEWTVDLGGQVTVLGADEGLVVARVAGAGRVEVLALDQDDGTTLWRAAIDGAGGGATIVPGRGAAVAAQVVVAGGTTLAAFDAGGCGAPACAPTWTAALDAPASSEPVSGGGVVYVGEADGTVQAFDAGGCGAAACAEIAHVALDLGVSRLIVDGGHLYAQAGATAHAFAPDAGP